MLTISEIEDHLTKLTANLKKDALGEAEHLAIDSALALLGSTVKAFHYIAEHLKVLASPPAETQKTDEVRAISDGI